MNAFKLKLVSVVTLAALMGSGQALAAIPEGSVAAGTTGGIAIGSSSSTGSNGDIALGLSAVSSGGSSVAIGRESHSAAMYGIALGWRANSSAVGAVALGRSSNASGENSSALGAGATATEVGSIALGNGSLANRAQSSFGVSSDGTALTEAVSFGNIGDKTSKEWTSTLGVVSIGSDTASRQLTGLAAGSQDNDAVNVAQLKSLQQSSLFGFGVSNLDGSGTAVQGGAALGDNSQVLVNGGVAIGLNSVASNEGRTAPVYLKTDSTTGGAWQTDENHGLVSFGGSYEATVTADDGSQSTQTVNFNRQITGVAAGSEDNDAVNVAQLKEVNNQVQGLITGDTKVSTIQLTPVDENGQAVENAPTIGLRYQVASDPNAQADGDAVTPTSSQGRLIYNNLDAQNNVIGTETIATLSDGIKLSGGTTTGADGTTVDSVNVNLNQGISFLGDEYLQTTVTAGENGGAVVTVGASQALKDFLANSGVQPSDPSNPSNPGGGSTGGTWTPNAAQQAALNGNFANGITVAAGEGNQAIQIKQGNVDMGGNRIQNVGNPINDGDAANKAYVDSTSRSLRNKINDVDKDLRAGVAMAMAVGNLPQAYMPGKSILAVSAGTYHGQGGFALGLSHATDNRQWVFKGAASVDTRGNFGGTLSAGYQF